MTPEEGIQAARSIIGEGRPDDYKLDPSQHANELADRAPALAGILQRPELSAAMRRYKDNDSEALAAQNEFRRTGRRANSAIFFTTCIGALLVTAVPLLPDRAARPVMIVLAVCGIVCGGLASMWLFKIREGSLLEEWMAARAAAETARLDYFILATTAQSRTQSDIPLPLLQLEYFRRYQLDVQLAYYRTRGAEHKQAASRVVGLGAFAALLASVASGLGGVLGGALSARWVSLAGLATVAAALSSFAAAREALGQDRRNAERYARTRAALDDLAGRLDEVRMSAAGNTQQAVGAFVSAVQEQLSLEHRQWLGTAESTKASLARLEEALRTGKEAAAKGFQRGQDVDPR